MSHKPSITLVVTVGFLLVATSLVFAVNEAPTQPVATIVSVEDATTTYHSQDWNGQTVTVQVPSQSSEDIKGRDAQGIVHATVSAVDTTINRVKVGFDHGAGHPLLFLDDAKAPNCRNNNGCKDLGKYSEWPKVAGAVIKA